MSNQLQISGAAKIRTIQGPVVANSGVITALDGDASQYVRGDGTLADFPTSTGGGSSVSYYLNTSVSQGTIGGVAYKQLSKVPIAGAGTDVSTSVDGYIASYITDANDPALLEVPAGNFNCEFYFSVNSNAHNPYVYAEVYKYDGTTFTLLGSNVSIPQYLSNGTTLSPYYFAIAVSTAVLTVTDRIAIRIYVNVDGRTVTLHTENNHLCQVVTTFSKGLISLNNLTRQNQFFQTGTSGTDFGISSSTATHTFNLPVASAANTGKLSSTDWSTFNGKVPYTGATTNVTLGAFNLTADNINLNSNLASLTRDLVNSIGILRLQKGANGYIQPTTLSVDRTYTLPDASGTIALTSNLSSYLPLSGGTLTGLLNGTSADFSSSVSALELLLDSAGTASATFVKNTNGTGVISTGSNQIGFNLNNAFFITSDNKGCSIFSFNHSSSAYTYTLPSANGTIALTTDLGSYLPLSGGTLTGALNGTSAVFSSTVQASAYRLTGMTGGSGALYWSSDRVTLANYNATGVVNIEANGGTSVATFGGATYNNDFVGTGRFTGIVTFGSTLSNGTYAYTLPSATGTLALGTGTTNYHAKWTGTNIIGNSLIWDNGTNVGIGNQGTTYKLEVTGTFGVSSTSLLSGNVGIGVAASSAKLQVLGYVTEAGIGNISIRTTDNINNTLTFSHSTGFADIRSNEGLRFYTGSASTTLGITITKIGGYVLMGTTSVVSPGGVDGICNIANASTSDGKWALALQNSGTVAGAGRGIGIRNTTDYNSTGSEFIYCVGNTTARFIAVSNGGLYNYSSNNVNLASDRRLKKDIVPLSSEWEKLKQIEVVNYKYKDATDETSLYGAIAQQVQEVYPELVIVTREATETEPEYYGLREQPFQWLTTKVLQEAMAKIEELQSRLDKAGL